MPQTAPMPRPPSPAGLHWAWASPVAGMVLLVIVAVFDLMASRQKLLFKGGNDLMGGVTFIAMIVMISTLGYGIYKTIKCFQARKTAAGVALGHGIAGIVANALPCFAMGLALLMFSREMRRPYEPQVFKSATFECAMPRYAYPVELAPGSSSEVLAVFEDIRMPDDRVPPAMIQIETPPNITLAVRDAMVAPALPGVMKPEWKEQKPASGSGRIHRCKMPLWQAGMYDGAFKNTKGRHVVELALYEHKGVVYLITYLVPNAHLVPNQQAVDETAIDGILASWKWLDEPAVSGPMK